MKRIFILVTLLLSSINAFSQNYNLDTTFGDGGTRVFNDLPFYPIDVLYINGSYFFLSTNGMAKVTYDGSLDTTFGTDGVMSFSGYTFSGFKYINNYFYVFGKTSSGSENAVIMKIDDAGNADTPFGTNGIANIDFGKREVLTDFIIGQDGKLYCTGTRYDPDVSNSSRLIYFRLNSSGTLDSTFDPSGYKTYVVNLSSKGAFIKNWGDKIILLGTDYRFESAGSYYGDELLLIQLDSTGNVVTSFGTDGHKFISGSGLSLITPKQLHIVENDLYLNYFSAFSFTTQGSQLLKYNLVSGQTEFNHEQSYEFFSSINNDGIYLAQADRCYPPPCSRIFKVEKENFEGTTDTSFQNNGVYTYFFPTVSPVGDSHSRVVVKEGNKILVGGYVQRSIEVNGIMISDIGFALLRLAEGPLDILVPAKNDISISPNPFRDHIILQSQLELKEVSIFDLSGRHVGNPAYIAEKGSIVLRPDIRQKGIYILKATTIDGQQILKKIVKE